MFSSAVVHGKAQLACDIEPPSADDSVALILWYKDDSLAPIYTVDARKGESRRLTIPILKSADGPRPPPPPRRMPR